MKIGLIDCDSHNYPNLALMKISAWHKSKGDQVEWWIPLMEYDKVYCSKVFGENYSKFDPMTINAKEIEFGGTGFAIKLENGKEVYHKELDKNLPYEIEHIYPDYSLYPELTKNTAYGFLTRGCPNNCDFCIVSKKESRCSTKVADLKEFWNGQQKIEILDPNILACKDHLNLLEQLRDSKAQITFSQGLDCRFLTEENAKLIDQLKIDKIHFAFDFMRNEERILNGLQIAKKLIRKCKSQYLTYVYMLTNYDTTLEQDLYRVEMIKKAGFMPYVMVYMKDTAPQITKDLQRFCNNMFINNHHKNNFLDYIPRQNKTIKEIYGGIL